MKQEETKADAAQNLFNTIVSPFERVCFNYEKCPNYIKSKIIFLSDDKLPKRVRCSKCYNLMPEDFVLPECTQASCYHRLHPEKEFFVKDKVSGRIWCVGKCCGGKACNRLMPEDFKL